MIQVGDISHAGVAASNSAVAVTLGCGIAGAMNLDLRLSRPHRTVFSLIETKPSGFRTTQRRPFCADVGWQNDSL